MRASEQTLQKMDSEKAIYEEKYQSPIISVHSPDSSTISPMEKTDVDDLYNELEKGNISVETKPVTELQSIAMYIQGRTYLLSSLIGDIKPIENRRKGVFGLIVWSLNLMIHFSFDFYEASFLFHVSWASSIGVYLVMFVLSTIYIIKHTFRWYVKIIKKLAKEEIYSPTLKKLKLMFQVLPFAMLVQSATGAAAQYGCYAYDGALTLEFTKSTSNGTTVSTVPREAELALNVLRFTSLTHIYYMMFLIFDIQCIIFFTVVHSQNRFNEFMGKELKAHPPAMSFQQAVNRFVNRTKLLRGASENTTVVLSTLLTATSISFVINAYNFLFIKRFAIYVWFAIAPLLWAVTPLIGGALVTSSFQKLKLVIMQSWVEIPEKYDQLWSRTQPHLKTSRWKHMQNNTKIEGKTDENGNDSYVKNKEEKTNTTNDGSDDVFHELPPEKSRLRSRTRSFLEYVFSSPIKRKNTINNSHELKTKPVATKKSERPASNEEMKFSADPNLNEKLRVKDLEDLYHSADDVSRRESFKSNKIKKTSSDNYISPPRVNWQNLRNRTSKNSQTYGTRPVQNVPGIGLPKLELKNSSVDKSKPALSKVVGVMQKVNNFKKKRRKFNYEKFIKFLELTVDTIGFSLGKVTITWDRVSFFIILLLSLVGVFAQNAFLK